MGASKWTASKKYPGIRWYRSQRKGRVFYITFKRDGKKIWEKNRSRNMARGVMVSARC